MTREPINLDQPGRGEILKVSIGGQDFTPAESEAVAVVRRICDEIDEDRTYQGAELIFWLTGIVNGLASGTLAAHATDGATTGGAQ